MDLDKRILDGKRPLTALDTDVANVLVTLIKAGLMKFRCIVSRNK